MAFTFLIFLLAIVYVGMILRDANILGVGTASYLNSTAATSYTLFGVSGIMLMLGIGAIGIFLLMIFISGRKTPTQPQQK